MSTKFEKLYLDAIKTQQKTIEILNDEVWKLRSRVAELEAEHVVWLNGAENIVKRLKGEITELEALVERLVDEGCVVAERFSAHGGSESDLEGWENVLDEYRELCPTPPVEW